MRYIKANDVLPEEIIALIQRYVDGEYVYIPRKDGKQKSWGELSGARASLRERNVKIYGEYKAGASIPVLSQSHYLSEQSIRRIILQEKHGCSSSLQSR